MIKERNVTKHFFSLTNPQKKGCYYIKLTNINWKDTLSGRLPDKQNGITIKETQPLQIKHLLRYFPTFVSPSDTNVPTLF